MTKLTKCLVVFMLLNIPVSFADDGMWTFDNPPRKQWKERYNFAPTEAWLEHLRLASVRLNDGGSGSFVSPDGLMVTNQHVASGQLQKVSTKDKDYTKEGFYARTNDEELKCPDLECNVLVSYEGKNILDSSGFLLYNPEYEERSARAQDIAASDSLLC